MTPEAAILALLAGSAILAIVAFWRLTASTGTITWTIRPLHDEELRRVLAERDEARRLAERIRDQSRLADTLPPEAP